MVSGVKAGFVPAAPGFAEDAVRSFARASTMPVQVDDFEPWATSRTPILAPALGLAGAGALPHAARRDAAARAARPKMTRGSRAGSMAGQGLRAGVLEQLFQ